MKRWMGFALCVMMVACTPDSALPTLVATPENAALVATLPVVPANATPDALGQRPTLPPTFTATFTPSVTASITPSATASVTASATITDTPTITPTFEPTQPPEARPLTSLLQLALETTILPSNYVVPDFGGVNIPIPSPVTATPFSLGVVTVASPLNCAFFPSGGFATIYTNNPDLAASLGCVAGNPPDVLSRPAAWQNFVGGTMVWINGEIYTLYAQSSTYQYFTDTFLAGVDPESSADVPPSGLLVPVRGFNKVWANNPIVKSNLGFAYTPEQGGTATVQAFQNGLMVFISGRADVLVMIGGNAGGTWRSVIGNF